MRLSHVVVLSLSFVLHPCYTFGSIGDGTMNIVGEYEGASTYGIKVLIPQLEPECEVWNVRLGFFLGGKFSTSKLDGKKYNWSQSRAETFYKSEFRGYSDKQLYGLNCGLTCLLRDYFYLYGGLGFIHSEQYRQYYDDTFTTWSNEYYIKDGMREMTLLDLVIGGNLQTKGLVAGIGYSTGTSNVVFSLGIRF
jgi:hypothetical protein